MACKTDSYAAVCALCRLGDWRVGVELCMPTAGCSKKSGIILQCDGSVVVGREWRDKDIHIGALVDTLYAVRR
jgi:hypothetical protein